MTDKQRTDLLTIPPGAVIFDRLVYEKECKAYTGLCRMTRLRMEKAGTFPVPLRLDGTKTAKTRGCCLSWWHGRAAGRR